MKNIKSNKLKLRIIGIAITVVVLALIILVNVFTGMLTDRFFIRADLTETGVFTISEGAAEFLRDLDEVVDIIVLAEESEWRANPNLEMLPHILQNYSATSGGRLRVQYVNPDLNSFDGPRYNNSLSDLQEAYTELENMVRNDIIFLSERRATVISAASLFVQRADQLGRPEIAIRADQELISSLIYVLNEEIAHIVFIDNHGERSLAHFTSIFDRSGYGTSTINLATEDIPEDTVVLVSAAPQRDFLNEEIIKLEQFMLYGGNLIILHDDEIFQNMPLLTNFMAEWGLTIENKLVFDDVFTYIPQLGIIGAHVVHGIMPSTEVAHAFTVNEEPPLGVFRPRPMTSVDLGRGFEIYPLVQTFSATSYAKDTSGGDVTTHEREPGDESGPFVLAYHVSRVTTDRDGNQARANLIVAGVSLFDDVFLSLYGDSFYNRLLINNLANDFNPFDGRVFIPPTELSGSQMLVSAGAARTILIVMVIMLPLSIIAAGVVVWLKRRHK